MEPLEFFPSGEDDPGLPSGNQTLEIDGPVLDMDHCNRHFDYGAVYELNPAHEESIKQALKKLQVLALGGWSRESHAVRVKMFRMLLAKESISISLIGAFTHEIASINPKVDLLELTKWYRFYMRRYFKLGIIRENK